MDLKSYWRTAIIVFALAGIVLFWLCADRLSSGLELLTKGGVDVVLLDLSLPDSKGFDTFSKVHTHAKELPVIILTGLDDEELAMKAVRDGAQDYVAKGSVNSQSLVRSVRFAVERRLAGLYRIFHLSLQSRKP